MTVLLRDGWLIIICLTFLQCMYVVDAEKRNRSEYSTCTVIIILFTFDGFFMTRYSIAADKLFQPLVQYIQ
jgi:hypothetical protein